MSGFRPARSCMPPRATREPVITSSKMETAPCFWQSVTISSKNPGTGGTQPMLPTTGSTMTAAMRWPRAEKSSFNCAKLLYAMVVVLPAALAGTPAESGTPRVAAPEPAFTSRKSAWPW